MDRQEFLNAGIAGVIIVLGVLYVASSYMGQFFLSRNHADIDAYRYVATDVPVPADGEITPKLTLENDIIFIKNAHRSRADVTCKGPNRQPERIDYFTSAPWLAWMGQAQFRYAVVCGNRYAVVDVSPDTGVRISPPYKTPGYVETSEK